MAIFGSFLDDLLKGSGQPQPAMASSTPQPQIPAWRVPMQTPDMQPQMPQQQPAPAPPDALTALAQYRQNQNVDPPWWRTAAGLLGGALQDYSAARAGHPELASGMSDFMGGLRQRQADKLGTAAQNQIYDELSRADQTKPLPTDVLLQIAKLGGLGGNVQPFKDYLTLRASTAKEQPHFGETPQVSGDGRAYVVGNDGSVKWLDGVQPARNPNQPFNADGTPNAAYQAYQLKLKSTGVPRAPKAQKADTSNPFNNPGQY